TGRSLANLALASWRQKKNQQALELFSEARQKFVAEENQLWPSKIDLYRANISASEGNYAEAQKLGLSVLRFIRKFKNPHTVISSQLLLAQSYLAVGKLSQARHRCNLAIRALQRVRIPALACQAHQLMAQIHGAARRKHAAYRSWQKARQIFETL